MKGYIDMKKNIQHIGPHNIDILSILFGALLGDAHGEMRTYNYSVRFSIKQSNRNMEYLMWFHNAFAERNFCNSKKPSLHTTIGKKGKKYFYILFHTYSYCSLLFLYKCFYYKDFVDAGAAHDLETTSLASQVSRQSIEFNDACEAKGVKRIPNNNYLDLYLTPLALAVWFMDAGSKASAGAKIATNCFIQEDLERLILFLSNKYSIRCKLHKQGSQHIIYIPKNSMPIFSKTIKKYLVPSMYYKLNNF